MAYSPVVNVQIAINAVSLSQAGFGTPIFICAHQQTDSRVIEIASAAELLVPTSDGGYGFSPSSSAYLAATQFFVNNPSVTVAKIGRRASQTVSSLSQVDPTTPETYNINIVHVINNNETTYSASYTHSSGEDAQVICDALVATLDSSGARTVLNVEVVGTGSGATIVVSAIDPDTTFRVTTSTQGSTSDSFNTSAPIGIETATEVITAIEEADSDFYFVTTEVRPNNAGRTFCQDMSTEIQARDKQYFVSSGEASDLLGTDPTTSFFKYALDNGRTHTVTFWHHYGANVGTLGEAFPECYFVGYNAPYDAGSVTWCNLSVGLPPSGQPNNNSKPLNTTQLSRLNELNANYVQRDAGANIIRTGITAGGEWIDVIRGVHWLTEDMTVSLKGLLFNQKGGKVSYDNQGISRVREVLMSSLQRAVNRRFLDSYTLNVPLVSNVSNADFIARVLKGVNFTGILTGAIHTIDVVGQVTTPTAV